MGALPQALKIFFELQMKRSNEKITRRKISFPAYKTCFFFGPLLLSNCITFLFLIHFKRYKVLWECHLKFYKSSFNSNSNRATYNEFCGVQELAFVVFSEALFSFLSSWPPFTLGGHNFLISNSFFMIISVPDVPRGGIQVLFQHQKQQNPPLGSGLP
jgi:Trk-type K+ transport system membrane component